MLFYYYRSLSLLLFFFDFERNSMMKITLRNTLDACAMSLSGLCLIHCIALPLLGLMIPLFGAWSKAEWVHLVFAAIALPLSITALIAANTHHRLPRHLLILAVVGLVGLVTAAFEWPSELWATPMTITSSLLIAYTHLHNWRLRHRLHSASPASRSIQVIPSLSPDQSDT